jgi:hypothetical protein
MVPVSLTACSAVCKPNGKRIDMTRLIAMVCFIGLILAPISALARSTFKCKTDISVTFSTNRSDRTCAKWEDSDNWSCVARRSPGTFEKRTKSNYMRCGLFVPKAHKFKLLVATQKYEGGPMVNLCTMEISAKVLDLLFPLMTNFKLETSNSQHCVITKKTVNTLFADITLNTR